ncbi:TonB-dependent receptor [Stenotrophomonas sp. SY1]|jgi:iron complex outermembrane receptor protein|uniref:TonB-dependent receptor n=1 Tax=Stenotrophomonas sp. SY1 TaxID=477235 RepID=UPI001E4FF316|nr:TonB-dependent receptor [Stenotrophomonas sp. SY1]MCD9085461.1 TonB-dependent receptor [Stenotrophomonas sp. SY1]
MKNIKPDLLCSAIAMALLLCTGNAAAQDAAAASATPAASDETVYSLDQITVTARGVAEPLQQMPLPITAMSEQTIEKKGLVDIRDIANLTPSFSFKSGYGRGFDRPVIRGMSNIQGEANASFFIDGIYVEGDVSSYGLENIQRVEVIRGPQSAAFGRRTFSGAINFITKRPGSDRGGKIRLGAGNYGQEEMGLFYSGGNEDGSFGYDFSLNKRGNDGVFFNQASGDKDLGGNETTSVMAAVAWSPIDQLNITARVMQQKSRDEHFPIARLGSENLNCYLPEYTGAKYFGLYPVLDSRRRGYYCGDLKAPSEYAINTKEFVAAGYFPGRKTDLLRTSLVLDYLFDNGWNFTSTSAYNDSETYSASDQDYSAIRGYGGAFESFANSGIKNWSQDFRLSSDQSLPVSGMVGAYYYQQQAQPGWGGDLTGFTIGGNKVVTTIPTDPDDKTTNKAIYGLINWHITDKWTTSLEGRYAWDEISKGGVDTRVLGTTTYTQAYALSETFKSFTPRWTLSYQAAENVNLYGLVSKGNKPGGFNTDVYRADFLEAERDLLIARGLETYEEEEAWNYELGIKSDWLDGTLRLNANIYQIDWTNQQLTETGPVMRKNGTLFATSYTTNVGESRIRGFELEGQWAFAHGWVASLAYSYTDAEILHFLSQDQADLFSDAKAPTLADPAADAAGYTLPRVPKNKATLGLMYDGALGNGWEYTLNMDTTYEGRRYVQVDNLASLAPSTRTNFRFSLRPTEQWQVSAYVNNAFNDRTPEDAQRTINPDAYIAIPAVPPLTGLAVSNLRDFGVTPSLPRMYGVEVSYKF